MRILTLNETGLVAGGRAVAHSEAAHAHADGDYGGYGGYGGYGSYGGGVADNGEFFVSYDPSNPDSVDTISEPSNVTTLPTVTVTAPTGASDLSNFFYDAAGDIASLLCATYAPGMTGKLECIVAGRGAIDFIKDNPGAFQDVGAYNCAKLGQCYNADRSGGGRGVGRSPVQQSIGHIV